MEINTSTRILITGGAGFIGLHPTDASLHLPMPDGVVEYVIENIIRILG